MKQPDGSKVSEDFAIRLASNFLGELAEGMTLSEAVSFYRCMGGVCSALEEGVGEFLGEHSGNVLLADVVVRPGINCPEDADRVCPTELADAFTMDVIEDVIQERLDQLKKWSREHDDEHCHGELGRAGACLASDLPLYTRRMGILDDPWPFCEREGTTESEKAKMPRRAQLVRATAFLVAEIERLDRTAKTGPAVGDGR